MFASDKQCSNTSISLLNRESRPCFAGIGRIKPMLNKITERSMRLERKRKEHVACLWIFRFREHRLSILSREIIQSSWTGQMGRIYIYIYHRYGRVDHLIKITRAGRWLKSRSSVIRRNRFLLAPAIQTHDDPLNHFIASRACYFCSLHMSTLRSSRKFCLLLFYYAENCTGFMENRILKI